MEKYVLDTNLFFNMESGLGIGQKTEEVVILATNAMRQMKSQGVAEFFAPPKIIDEFLSFFEDKEQPFIKEFLSTLTVKSPDLHAVVLPAFFTAQLIEDVRSRNFRGQAIAEEEIAAAAKQMGGVATQDKKSFEMQLGPIVKRFRTKFRQATRFGFLDSVADMEIIVLAKEIDGLLVSADEGLIRWARTFGVKEIAAPVFGSLLHRHQATGETTNPLHDR